MPHIPAPMTIASKSHLLVGLFVNVGSSMDRTRMPVTIRLKLCLEEVSYHLPRKSVASQAGYARSTAKRCAGIIFVRLSIIIQ